MNDIVELKNSLKVANFSSPHTFTFDDGTIVDACSKEMSDLLKIDFIETPLGYSDAENDYRPNKVETITLKFDLPQIVADEIVSWMGLYQTHNVDVVLVPLAMLQAMKASGWSNKMLMNSPFRSIRIEDRTNKVISSRKFCI